MSSYSDKIAVIGMACKFPGADNLNDFWNILVEGRDTITHFTDDELAKYEYDFESLVKDPDYVKARGVLKDIDMFDANFFGYTPKEAEGLDPQYRIWLETVWQAFENAGCDPFIYKGKIGVFAGGSTNTYLLNNILRDQKQLEHYIRMRSAESYQTMIGNEVSGIPTKTAYKLNLKGPAINVQTACSTSLVAVSMACQSLLILESDVCLAGGVTVSVPQETGYLFQEGAIASPDGVCRSFDSQAKGTVFGNGVGVVVLKRLEDAIRDHDNIYSVVTGWALNNDGNDKVSYVAPSVEGQAEVIQMAQSFAQVSPEEIGYIEAHGTATQLGDPIELTALLNAFRLRTEKKQFCGIGSVKSNIGHTDTAAGIAGFIKASLSVYNRIIPPTIHYKEPNPYFNFADSPFYVLDKLKKWDSKKPLIVGISSFGIGGTNAHVIIEEPPLTKVSENYSSEWPELIILSAKSEYSLDKRKTDIIELVREKPELKITDLAYTLGTGRHHMKYRSFGVASDLKELTSTEMNFINGQSDDFISKIAFMFPGQGAQYRLMGYDLYKSNILFKEILDECFELVLAETGENLKSILFPGQLYNEHDAETKLTSTELTQPALFIIEYALSKVLMNIGIKPDYLIGHSIGEYVAACISGVFTLHDALLIVIMRGRLMKSMPSGEMLAVQASKENLENIRRNNFGIAAENADNLCTISVKLEDRKRIKLLLDENGFKYVPLKTSHAFHSAAFDPILNEFSNYVGKFKLNSPELPFISCLSGEFITNEQATSGEYWAKQLRNTVLFRKGISTINDIDGVAFLEVGPNTHLTSLVKQNSNVVNKKAIIPTLGKYDKIDERYRIINALGNLFNAGIKIDFDALFNGYKPLKLALPEYAFERKRCWIDFSLSEVSSNDPDFKQFNERSEHSGKEINDAPILKTGNEESVANIILAIWKSLFGINDITVDDNFFDIGGHSLLALQIITRIKETLHQNISLKTFLDNPTITLLTSVINAATITDTNEYEYEHQTDHSCLPLSDNQKRLWIVSRLDNLNPAYNIAFTYRLKGDLNPEVFTESINILFQRHHIMFSTFHDSNEVPYSKISVHSVHIDHIDFSEDLINICEEKIMSFIGADSRKCFDIEKGPLYRLYLLKQSETEYYFHATIHHLIFDGWSWGVFIRDFNTIYNSIIINEEVKLKELSIQYYDYAKWKETSVNLLNVDELTKFWIDYLKDCVPVISFPYDHPRNNFQNGLGEKEYIRIPAEVTSKLKEISKKEKATLFSTLLSAFGLLLHKYSGVNDFCVGTPVANRPQSKLEDIFGMFINTIAIRIKIDENESFSRLTNLVKESTMEAISHQELPFEKVVEAVNPARTFSMNPLFQICFAWQNNLSIPMDLKDLRGERVTIREGISPFDLTLYMWENDDFLEGEIEYSTNLLDRETILRLKNNFLNLINNLVINPEMPIKLLSMISEEDKNLIRVFNNTSTSYPKDRTIAELFEEQVTLFPDKSAVEFNKKSLTYKQLNERTNKLARTLRVNGIIENSLVGIYADKSIEMIIGILAILKAGGGYVPLDPEYPEQRINFILKDSGCKILLVQDKYIELALEGVQKINLNSLDSYSEDYSDLEKSCSSSDLAYIMYTSGTTGIPKGSMILQKSVVRLVRNTNYIELTPDDRILLTGAIVFDATTFEIWGALLNGGTLYIEEKETILNPKALGDKLNTNDITVLWLTSPLFTQIAEQRIDIFSKLKYLLVGGDVLSAAHINKVRKANPGLKVINGYGPTENTTFSTTFLIEEDFDRNIPIGKPISNSTAYIFDKNMNYQPVGVVGELYVGGDGLSKGYLNREDLNKKSFIEHPHIPGERIYRTGDYARWLSDGNIEFHGRIDNQLKIRGFRVELEEIESAISEVEGIIETVVKPIKIQEGDLRLAAFLNVSETFSMDAKEVSNQIKEKLPSYMVPSAFKFMHGFPRTINGKIDRNALNFDLKELNTKASEEIKVLTPTEKIIHKIWSEALKTEEISVTDNFFDVGGNSLIAISVFSKIETALDVNLGLRVFFDSPRIKDLGEVIDIKRYEPSENISPEKRKNDKSRIIKGEI